MSEVTILETLSTGPAAISTLAKAANLDHAKTAKILKALIKDQKIVKTGAKRGTRYHLAA